VFGLAKAVRIGFEGRKGGWGVYVGEKQWGVEIMY
jgi:hypothetical protein